MNRIESSARYTCFTCLGDSTDPLVCTCCGATIGQFDPAAASFSPPMQGKYLVHPAVASKEAVRDVLRQLREEYFQSIDAQEVPGGVVVRSNDIAYDKFIELLRTVVGIDARELKESIPFEAD